MAHLIKITAVTILCGSIFFFGSCTKKTTKVEPPLAAANESVKPTPYQQGEKSFETGEMDNDMRDILIPLYFDYDKSNLRPDAIRTLEKIAPYLAQNESMKIVIEGHADERGTDEYNIGLGENRSKSAKDYLTKYGISRKRFETVSYGKAKPANPYCEDENCHSLNRRVEWRVLTQ